MSAPGKRSFSVFSPGMTGIARWSRRNSSYWPWIMRVSAIASSFVSWAVWPSCQRNSAVRRNKRGRISQRITFAHWLIKSGRSRYDSIQRAKAAPMIVSEVGRITYGSASSPAGIILVLPVTGSFTASRRWCVTTAHSVANPSACSASFSKYDSGMSSGKYAFWWPVALKRRSSCCWINSQMP